MNRTDLFDPIEGFKILNMIQPKYYQTAYPYNTFTTEKINQTKRLIKQIIEKNQITDHQHLDKSHLKHHDIKGGDQSNYTSDLAPILFYEL